MISIVDDDVCARKAVEGLVRSLGYVVVTFTSAEDFLDSAHVNDTSCLFTDVHMPGLSGVELYRRLLADGFAAPTIFVSGLADETTRTEVLAAGAVGFLRKPFGPRQIPIGASRVSDRPHHSGPPSGFRRATARRRIDMFGAPRDDARLRDFKPKLEQFTMDTRRAPKRVLDAHPPDQRTQARINLGVALPVAGPTGIHLVAELRKTTAAVRVVARGMDKFARLFPDAAVEKRPADILDDAATLRALDGCDLVYDCIGLPGDQMHLHPVTARNIASALRHTKARVQVSSYWAYYPQVRAEMNESHHAHSRQPHELSEWSIRAA